MAPALQFQALTNIVLTDEERIAGTLSPEHAAIAIHALHTNGLVALENAVSLDHVAILNEKLCSEVKSLSSKRGTHFVNISADGRDTGNMSQGPPLEPDLIFGNIWANGPALAVISGVIGPSPYINWARQNVHADSAWNHGTFPHSYATNYFLCDVSEEYGSTEVWLGSHTDTTFNDYFDEEVAPGGKRPTKFGIRYELLEERRKWAPPIYPTIKKGSVVIRDMRLWHAGMPSKSKDFRIVLGFVYTPWWYQCKTEVVLPSSARGLVEQWSKQKHPAVYNAHFVGPDVENKRAPVAGFFDSANEGYKSILPCIRTVSSK